MDEGGREREGGYKGTERERERGKEGGKDECILHLVAPGQRCEKGRRRRRLRGPPRRRDMNATSIAKGAPSYTYISSETVMSVRRIPDEDTFENSLYPMI